MKKKEFSFKLISKFKKARLGIIKSSNLCTEILEYSDDKEYACCTLASICLSRFVEQNPNINPTEQILMDQMLNIIFDRFDELEEDNNEIFDSDRD